MNNNEFFVFKDYVGLKVHFNVWEFNWRFDYDYHMKESALAKRNDKHFFERFSSLFSKRNEWVEFLISCFMRDKRMWVGDMFEEDLKDYHRSRMIKRVALIYTFRNDAENIFEFMAENNLTLKELLKTKDQRPLILKIRQQIHGGVSDETLALFDKFFRFTQQKTLDPLWEEERLRYYKYGCLLKVEKLDQIKSILNQLLAHPSVSAHGH
jgi:hypothetical protein